MMIRMAADDPYEFLFGWSNRRLGRLNSMFDSLTFSGNEQSRRYSKEPIRNQEGVFSHDKPKTAPSNDAAIKDSHSGSKATQGSSNTQKLVDEKTDGEATAKSAHVTRQQDRLINAHWTTSTINSSGEVHQSSGNLQYDPITMRMTSKQSFSPEKTSKEQGSAKPTESVAGKADNQVKHAQTNTTQPPELPKGRSIYYIVDDKAGSDEVEVNNPKKKQLEQSWAREKAPQKSANHTSQQPSPTPVQNGEDQRTMTTRKQLPEQPVVSEQQPMTRERGLMIDSMLKKKVPLKHMDAHDFHNHKVALLRNWSRIQRQPKSPTRADQKLADEIRSQKAVMDSIESRRSQKSEKHQQTGQASAKSTKASPYPETTPEPVAGEGDVSHNVAEFSNNDKWYKRPAPHASAVAERKQRDRELVQAVREIYEDAYGPIKPEHRQGRIISTNEKAAKASALLHDLGDAGHTRFAEFIKSNSGSSTMPKKFDGEDITNKPQSKPRTKYDVPKSPQVRLLDNIWNLRIYELSGEPSEEAEPALQRMSSLLGPARSIKDLCDTPKIPLINALSDLTEPGKFIERLVQEGAKEQDVVFAKNHILILRDPPKHSPQPAAPKRNPPTLSNHQQDLDHHTSQGFHVPPRQHPCTTKARFIDDFKPATNPRPATSSRRVHRQESVFSGAFPRQKFTIPEIIEILKDRGLVEGPHAQSGKTAEAETSSDSNGGAAGGAKGERSGKEEARQRRRRERPGFVWVLTIAGATATGCYSLGAVMEDLREVKHERVRLRRGG